MFTHGAYESAWNGFPVQWGPVSIGDRVWMPNAWVNPNVKVGNDVVVAALSLVSKDIPDGCLAGGIPCKVLKEKLYPRQLDAPEKKALFERIFSESQTIFGARCSKDKAPPKSYESVDEDTYRAAETTFDLRKRSIEGKATEFSEVLKNQLRRNGIRFRYCAKNGVYEKW